MDYLNKTRRGYGRFKKIYDIAMGIFYILFGIVIFMADKLGFQFQISNSETFFWIFGGVLILYGIYRVYRGLRRSF